MQGSLGVSAPVFDPDRKILGSITFAIPEARFATFDPAYLRAQIVEAAQRITDLIAEEAGMPFPPPPDEPVPASSASTV